jgi:hypothetical protein
MATRPNTTSASADPHHIADARMRTMPVGSSPNAHRIVIAANTTAATRLQNVSGRMAEL